MPQNNGGNSSENLRSLRDREMSVFSRELAAVDELQVVATLSPKLIDVLKFGIVKVWLDYKVTPSGCMVPTS